MWRRYLIGNPVFLSRVLAESRQHDDFPGLDALADRFGAARAERVAAVAGS